MKKLFVVALALAGLPGFSQTLPQGATAPVPSDYIIGPGDELKVFVLGNPELAAEVPVRPDGKISTPLAPDIVAVGKTPAQLSRDLEATLGAFVRNPNVSVIITKPLSSFSQIRVIGQAASPKAVPFRSGLTVLDVMIEVGGLSQFAAGNRAKIVRKVDGKTKEIKIRLADLMNKGAVSQDLPMQPGDVLVIPESRL